MGMGILGPLVFVRRGVSLVPSAPKVRQLLAFLMLNLNTVVRSSECMEELWGVQPPRSARSTLQTYVLHIRRMLKAAGVSCAETALMTCGAGYQLTDEGEIDRAIFQELAFSGRAAAAAGDDRQASALLSDALAVWRGHVLADVQVGPLSAAHVIELEESRKAVLEQRIEADLRLGRHRELLDELDALTAAHPMHENMHAQYMLALYRSGQPRRALAVYRRLSALLIDALGIEPTPRLRRLGQAILTGEPALTAHPAAVGRVATPVGFVVLNR
jgi:DNA-binding SARP family transcriptional activator